MAKGRDTKKKLGEILIDKGIIDQDQLNSALAHQRRWGHRLGNSLIAKGFIEESTLVQVLSEVFGLSLIDLSRIKPQPTALRLIPIQTCENHNLIPIAIRSDGSKRTMMVAMADPMNLQVLDELESTTGCRIHAVIAGTTAIVNSIRRYYLGEKVTIPSLETNLEKDSETPLMVVCRPGGQTSVVDTSTREGSKSTPAPVSDSRKAPSVDYKSLWQTLQKIEEIETSRTSRSNRGQAHREKESKSPGLEDSALTGLGQRPLAPGPLAQDQLDKIKKTLWALMRLMAKKGLITKEEFLRELAEEHGES